MVGWTEHTGTALVLSAENIDTDQLIPARFMSVPRERGYGGYLLHDLRRDGEGALLADFPLNQHPGVSILVAGRNFGSGSSREAAVYALVDAGFRVVISSGFGDIFAGNAVNNGLLPARVSPENLSILVRELGQDVAVISVNLEFKRITFGNQSLPFELDDIWRTKLINGWDDIDLTLHLESEIATYRKLRKKTVSWAWPHGRPGVAG